MNLVSVMVERPEALGTYRMATQTGDVVVAMDIVHKAWQEGLSCEFAGPYGIQPLWPPLYAIVSQLPDDSQARHDRNRARWKSP